MSNLKGQILKNGYFNCDSYTITKSGEIIIHQDTPATNWNLYIRGVVECCQYGTGYKVELYKRAQGIKKVIPNIKKKLKVLSTIRGSKKEQLSSLSEAR
jgi:hypothetical protein|tara:strand:+ start:400 stop:696 length:297 start_codon:yes stop_codon:yes gene_type:complete